MISVAKALEIIDREAHRLGAERIPLDEAVGRFLADDIVADTDLPPFDRSQMDGYAVRAADTRGAPVTLKIIGESAAGRGFRGKLKKSQAVRIMTGAPLSDGADSVQKLEVAVEKGDRVTLLEPTGKGRFIVQKGKEVTKGKVVLKKGETISPQNISLAAAFGYAKVKVAKRPRVAILSTGSEIVEINKKPKRDQIRNSNAIMLAALCRSVGCEVTVLPLIGDELSSLTSQIASAIRTTDVLVTSGGVSVGKYDLTKPALESLGAKIYFDRVALKPGKPTVFAKLRKTNVFGLPGNPVSASVTFHLFVRRFLLQLQGCLDPMPESGRAIAAGNFKGTKGRDSFLPASLQTDERGRLIATPLRWHGSSDFVGFAAADALVFVKRETSISTDDIVELSLLSRPL